MNGERVDCVSRNRDAAFSGCKPLTPPPHWAQNPPKGVEGHDRSIAILFSYRLSELCELIRCASSTSRPPLPTPSKLSTPPARLSSPSPAAGNAGYGHGVSSSSNRPTWTQLARTRSRIGRNESPESERSRLRHLKSTHSTG